MRENTLPSLCLSIPEWGEEAWLVSVLFSFICDRISTRRCAVYQQKWFEGHVVQSPKSKFRGEGNHTCMYSDFAV